MCLNPYAYVKNVAEAEELQAPGGSKLKLDSSQAKKLRRFNVTVYSWNSSYFTKANSI